MQKKCNICGKTKNFDEFPKRKLKSGRYSVHYACKLCWSDVQRKSRAARKDKEKECRRKYCLNNKDKILESGRKWEKKNRKTRSQKAFKRYHENRDTILAQRRRDYINNLEKYRKKSKDKCKTPKYKEWVEKNREVHRSYRREYYRKKREDPCFRLRKNVSRAVNSGLRKFGTSKAGKSIIIYLPYSIEDLKKHLESQFEEWMNWDNWGTYDGKTQTWQIDHIIPQSKLPYDSMNHPNFQKCWALNNLRPLSSLDNIKRGAKLRRKY